MAYLILIMFFVSGACGLVYEVVWGREFILVFGGATRAVTVVVASFMAGLGLGGLIGGRLIDRARVVPALVYGVLEGGIGTLALLTPLEIRACRPILAWACQTLGESSLGFAALRFFLCALILVPPTLLMGATLPVLMKATLKERARFGLAAGRLYALNTAGAVAGAALAGFVLLPALGGSRSLIAAAAANFAICGLILILRRRFTSSAAAASDETSGATSPERPPFDATVLLVLIGYGLSGLAALVYQIAWTRALTLTLGGSTYTFSLILTAYIAGLALGGAAITLWVDRIKRPLLAAGLIEFAIGLAALAALPLLDNLNLAMCHWAYDYRWGQAPLRAIRFGGAFAVVAAPTFLMGALLPLIARVVSRHRPGTGEPMGLVYAANTLGAIVGAFLAGLWLIDLLGVRGTVLFGVGLCLAVGVAWIMAGELRRPLAAGVGLGAILAAVLLFKIIPPPDPLVLNSGPYIYADKIIPKLREGEKIAEYLDRIYELKFFEEDAETTVAVLEDRTDAWRVLRINGKTDASSLGDMPNQVLLAQLPLLFHPRPKTAMVLGLASGVTAGSALLHDLERLDCLELSPAVARASAFFSPVNNLKRQGDAFADPRFHLIINDGRNHLLLAGQKYDAIISEPSNPWQAAMASMFTQEFFTLMKNSLNPQGIAIAWIDVYDMDPQTMALILRTFAAVFPHATLWESDPAGDYILMGSDAPFQIDYRQLEDRCQGPAARGDLARIQEGGAVSILGRLVLDDARLRQVAGPGELHDDDRRQLEFEMPRVAFGSAKDRLPELLTKFALSASDPTPMLRFASPDEAAEVTAQLKRVAEVRAKFIALERDRIGGTIFGEDYIARLQELLAEAGELYPRRAIESNLALQMGLQAGYLINTGDDDRAAALLEQAFALDPSTSRAATMIAQVRFNRGDLDAAETWAHAALDRSPHDRSAIIVLAKAARARNRFDLEEQLLRQALDLYPRDRTSRLLIARSLLNQKKLDPAIAAISSFLEDFPDSADAHFFMGLARLEQADYPAARQHFNRCLELDPQHPSAEQIKNLLKSIENKS